MADAVVDRELGSRTLNHLKTLLEQTKFLETVQESTKRETDELQALRNKIDELRRKKRKLETELDVLPAVSLGQSVLEGTLGQEFLGTDEERRLALEKDIQENLELDLTHRSLREQVSAFRLAGKTIFTTEDGRVALRLETFAQSKFHESYYIILSYDDDHEAAVVYRHTIPYFIPLAELVKEYLNKDVSLFMDRVSQYLNAFVSRRQQCATLKSSHKDLEISTTPAFDLVEFKAQNASRNYTVQLCYDDLSQSLPQRVAARYGAEPQRRDRRAESLFKSTPMQDAYVDVFGAR